MALRAFLENPSLGGFGGESVGVAFVGKGDAHSKIVKRGSKGSSNGRNALVNNAAVDDSFAQIVKELVDNAVDACYAASQRELLLETPTPATKGRRVKPREAKKNTQTTRSKDRPLTQPTLRRVRVVIQPETPPKSSSASPCSSDDEERDDELLRVTVTDNGCGMDSIQDCVMAFHTSKAASNQQQQTAGRYGMGLTLCLLHAQRLVGPSCTVITSATPFQKTWTRAKYVVDADNDDILCVFKEETKKENFPTESGTAVSLLLPGGIAARRAWPRLAEYFARFYLSLGNVCSMEVLAPTLSTMPLFIRPPIEVANDSHKNTNKLASIIRANYGAGPQRSDKPIKYYSKEDSTGDTNEDEDISWHDAFTTVTPRNGQSQQPNMVTGRPTSSLKSSSKDSFSNLESESDYSAADDDDSSHKWCPNESKTKANTSNNNAHARENLRRAVRAYLCQPIDIRNVAHSLQPIRRASLSGEQGSDSCEPITSSISKSKKRKMDSSSSDDKVPMMEVNMIIFEDKQEDECNNYDKNEINNTHHEDEPSSKDVAKLVLIRMVNRVPILDGAEAHACGLVRGIASKQKTWNLFGLDVDIMPLTNVTFLDSNDEDNSLLATNPHVPVFRVTDSSQLAPYLRINGTEKNRHSLYEGWESSKSEDDSYSTCTSFSHEQERSRNIKQLKKKTRLLPAGARLGNILVIIHVYSHPSALPMPTLSKGRLPLGDQAIDTALEIGIKSCLQSLQRTNPSLLLSPAQLRETEQDVIHIPEIAASMASIIISSPNICTNHATQIAMEWQQMSSRFKNFSQEEQLKEMIESRLHMVKSLSTAANRKERGTIESEGITSVISKRQTRSDTKAAAAKPTSCTITCQTPEKYLYIDMDDPEPCQGMTTDSSVNPSSDIDDGNTSISCYQETVAYIAVDQSVDDNSYSDEWW